MADAGTTISDEAGRLEAALDRIAQARTTPSPGQPATGDTNALLARRLDALIAELRAVLGRDSAD